ncbi:HAD family hydrolase [Coriobacteriia bacterium Es71-Z0120]|uniref:HAD family hydrolase n=1 Tax=Parvivirga hydrogeniphila TaxID=2939460 RepID=UPI00226097DD|nr:HAD family hydrolase [Parvivirga hydrogeniphila]MCL4078321.1 HAD family hydrolase [Parvivirga hydrogeniphila]
MIRIDIPGRGLATIQHLVLDVNGTIACDGALLEGVAERLERLRELVTVTAITADTHGTAAALRDRTGIEIHVIERGNEARQKLEVVRALGADAVVAVGNGANDDEMLDAAVVGICVIGREGAAVAALRSADVAVTDVRDALDLVLDPRRLVATLRR